MMTGSVKKNTTKGELLTCSNLHQDRIMHEVSNAYSSYRQLAYSGISHHLIIKAI